ncbi:WD40 repeat domain-containing protein [Sulfurimonas sp.]
MQVVNSQSISSAVILLKILDDGTLVAINSDTTVRMLYKETLELINGFKVGIKHERYKTKVVAFSNNAHYFTSISSNAKESILYNAQTKKIIGKVDRHHGEVSCVGIDPLSRFMFSCGDDGKTFAIDTQSGNLVFTLPMHIDTVNDIAFSTNANWVATASYDRKVSLFNLVTMTPKDKFKGHSAPVMKLQFLNQNELLSIDKSSTAIISDIHTGEIIKKLEAIHDDVTQICIYEDENLLFLATELGYVLLYDLTTFQQLSPKYIKVSSMITALEFDAQTKHLLVGTEDGFISRYNIYEGEEKLKQWLKNKDFRAIHTEVEKNPILQFTKIYELVVNFWNNSLEKAKILLQKGEKKTALALLAHFKNIPAKNTTIQQLFKDYEQFDTFKKFAQEGKLTLAYNLVNAHPIYKDSALYKALENRWKKSLVQAQKYVLSEKGVQKAKELMTPYRGITQKTKFIQEVMTNGEVYKRFRVAITQKDFKVCFELIKQNPFLKEFPEYDTLIKYADTLYIKSNQYLKEGNTHAAVKILRVLRNFPDFKTEVKKLMVELESKQKFFNAIEDGDDITAYNMMAISEDLLLTPDGKKLHTRWNNDVQNANRYAVIGDAVGVKNSLENYMNISSKYRSLATIFGWTYMVQLEDALKDGTSQLIIENGIKNYILNFGVQDQIENFFNLFKKTYKSSKLNLEILTKSSLSMWRPSMIVKSILD